MKTPTPRMALLLLLSTVCTPGVLAASSGQSLRIVPLGDSITYGYYSSTMNGYRQDLIDLLGASDVTNVTYLGDRQSGSMQQNRNEGYPGATISIIEQAGLNTLNSSREPSANPNVVLIHVGTNDAFYNHTSSAMISDLRHMLNTIYSLKPQISVVLSQIISCKRPEVQSTISSYNSMIPALVKDFAQMGKRIVMVNQSDVNLATDQNPQHADDDFHPGDVGFAKIARNFYYGVNATITKGWI